MGGAEGFFSENFKNLLKSQKEIEEVVELLNHDQKLMAKASRKQKETLNQFL